MRVMSGNVLVGGLTICMTLQLAPRHSFHAPPLHLILGGDAIKAFMQYLPKSPCDFFNLFPLR